MLLRSNGKKLLQVAAACAFTLAAGVPAARAQRGGSDMFVTPIPGAPFSATVQLERTDLRPDGSAVASHSTIAIARDADGRIHNEYRPFTPAAVTRALPILSIHLYDPQTRISTMLYPQQHTFSVFAVNRPPATDTPQGFASRTNFGAPPSQFASEQDLGTRTIAGLQAHGIRESQTIPAEASGTGQALLVTDDYWYSADLRINLEVVHTDPRLGGFTTTVTTVSRTPPDPQLFTVPADYQPARR